MLFDGISHQVPDTDPGETEEWLDSFDAIVDARGRARARYLLMKLLERARTKQVDFPATVSTPYVNTIPADAEPWFPGDEYQERRIRAYIRWNAAAMVTRANARTEGIGGHLSTYASSAALYEVGFNHFFRGKADGGFGDQVYFQGHASPGIYARAYVEGRLTERELDNFRHEVGGDGLPSYPHPRSLPEFWEFPTVSMGLGPIAAIYQAHVNRYLNLRHLVDTSGSRVWCFVGDGEMDEPESIGALGVAGREHLDNLIFVVNCNLQRLDGPVRGNGKIIQELEAVFRGAGWNVIKVIWGSRWDALLAKDVDGVLLDRMNTTLDGEYQKLAVESGAYIREHFFGPDPRLRKIVEDLSDDELVSLPRGGHDYRKLYAAYKLATEQRGAPTAILAKTIKGWTLGPEIEARNATHQIKKMTKAQLRTLRDRLYLTDDIPDDALDNGVPPYIRPAAGSDAMEYLRARGASSTGRCRSGSCARRRPCVPTPRSSRSSPRALGPSRCRRPWCSPACCATWCAIPPSARWWRRSSRTRRGPSASSRSSPRPRSTPPTASTTSRWMPTCRSTMRRARRARCSRRASPRRAPWPPSSPSPRPTPRGVSRWCRCISSIPCSASSAWGTSPGRSGTCAGAASWPAARRGGPRSWARDSSTTTASRRCSPRPTPPPWSTTPRSPTRWPRSWKPRSTEMLGPEPKDRFWYLTLYNETYPMPKLPEGEEGDAVRRGIIDGAYRYATAPEDGGRPPGHVVLLRADVERRRRGAADPGRALWRGGGRLGGDVVDRTPHRGTRGGTLEPAPSRRRHHACRTSRRHSGADRTPWWPSPTTCARVPDQVARFVERPYTSLGTDGFGRSDAREALRSYFEVDAANLVVAVLQQLARAGRIATATVAAAICDLGIDPGRAAPFTL